MQSTFRILFLYDFLNEHTEILLFFLAIISVL
jgi:hypothetical protein